MKFSLLKDDKSTHADEVVLLLISLLSLTFGILLVVFKPGFWIVSGELVAGFGVAAIIFAAMFIPCAIYRFFHKDA